MQPDRRRRGRRALRTLAIGLLIGIVATTSVAIGLLAFVTARALPRVSGTLAVAGLDARVTVVRDGPGIVHITADTPHDLFLAQGFVHAQERMWQMEVWRHISAGRIAERFGPTQVRVDRLIRLLGWRTAAQRDLEAASPELRAALDAYAAGVNAYLGGQRESLGLPFVVAGLRTGAGLGGYQPEPWTPLDSMAWIKVQAWNLGQNLDSEVFRMLADRRLGDPALTDRLFPPQDADAPIITQPAANGRKGESGMAPPPVRANPSPPLADAAAWSALIDLARSPSAFAGLGPDSATVGGSGTGSNSWVVGPDRSATGTALLANDPHLAITMPSLWFMNGLHCRVVSDACPFDVAGVSFPGLPAVVLGRNARIAWGATDAYPDVQDLVVERVDPADPGRYLTPSGSAPFETRTETIRVAGGEDVVLTVRSTVHGPILNDVEPRLAVEADLFALRWTGTLDVDGTAEAIFRINTARNLDEFRAALALYGTPAQNFVYADVDGHIAYQVAGAIPVRSDRADRGDRPVPGWDGAHEWVGRVPFDDLPALTDPPGGMIVAANNAILPPDATVFISREWDPGDRAATAIARLTEAAPGGITLDEMSAIQNDTEARRADVLIGAVRDLRAALADDARIVRERIATWDRHCGTESRGCAAAMTLEYVLVRRVFDRLLGLDLARLSVGGQASLRTLRAMLQAADDPWWDDPATRTVERRDDVLASALDESGRLLRRAYGAAVRWTWGRLHRATFRELTLGSSGIGPLEWLLNSGPVAVPGAAGALNNTSYRFRRAYPDPADPSYRPVGFAGVFEVTNLPSARAVFDLGAIDGGRVIQTTGNAGNPFDRHYGDLVDDWLAGRTMPLPMTPGAITANGLTTLTLVPDR